MTPTPAPGDGSRARPFKLGEVYTATDYGATVQFKVLRVVRGAEAQRMVTSANMFNDKAPSGSQYILVYFQAKYLKGSEEKLYETAAGGNRFYGNNRFYGDPMASVAPEPEFAGVDIFPGATVEGWLPGKYLPNEFADDAILIYGDKFFLLK